MPDLSYLLVVVGPNGSGKSSIIEYIIDELPEDDSLKTLRMINADITERAIAEISSIHDPLIRAKEAQVWCNRERKRLRGKHESFGYETVGSHPIPGERHFDFMQEARNLGYTVEMLFVSTENPAINIRRVAKRVADGGHGVSEQKIVERYYRTMNFLPQYLDACDFAFVIDNSIDDAPFRVLLSQERGSIELTKAGQESQWLKTYLPDSRYNLQIK